MEFKAVILAGGGGTRLWPLSTKENPKQFQKLTSTQSLLEETLNRLNFFQNEDIFLAINKEHYQKIHKLCPQIPKENLIIEPALRDTAPAIGLCASIIEKRFPGAVMCVIYADHLIGNIEEFKKNLETAAKIAFEENTLNIIEVPAKKPDVNFGYVEIDQLQKKIDNTEVYKLKRFIEKPSLAKAKKFLNSGNYLWNTGIYVWKASTILEQYAIFQPEMYQNLQKMITKNSIETAYPQLEKISIDYALMEKVPTEKMRILKADLEWSDIGNWEAVWQETTPEPKANVCRGNIQTLNCTGSLIYGDQRPIAVVGLHDIVVIDSPNGLLVCKKKDAKRVKEISFQDKKNEIE